MESINQSLILPRPQLFYSLHIERGSGSNPSCSLALDTAGRNFDCVVRRRKWSDWKGMGFYGKRGGRCCYYDVYTSPPPLPPERRVHNNIVITCRPDDDGEDKVLCTHNGADKERRCCMLWQPIKSLNLPAYCLQDPMMMMIVDSPHTWLILFAQYPIWGTWSNHVVDDMKLIRQLWWSFYGAEEWTATATDIQETGIVD